jgi:HK97 family phage prohead protease
MTTRPFTESITPFRQTAASILKDFDGADIKRSTACILEDKALTETDEVWIVTGLAAAFNNKDRGGDVIVPGAFTKTLREDGLPLILFQHKMDDAPVGTCLEAKETARGLWIKAAIPKDDDFCRGRLIPQLKRRGLKGMSIGYKPLLTERRKEDNARLLKEIRLYECSFVSLPMNPAAGVETVKADEMLDVDVRDAIRMLRETFQALNAEAVKMSCELATTRAVVASALRSTDRFAPVYAPYRSSNTINPIKDLAAALADLRRSLR